MKQRGTKAGIVIETLIILAGLALLGKAVMMTGSTYKFIHLAEATDGMINAVDDRGLKLNVEFTSASEKSIAFVQWGLFYGYQAGQHVPVLYDHNYPELAAVDNASALWLMPLLMSIPGFLLLFYGLRLRSERSL